MMFGLDGVAVCASTSAGHIKATAAELVRSVLRVIPMNFFPSEKPVTAENQGQTSPSGPEPPQ
jgi:hypothetical protein